MAQRFFSYIIISFLILISYLPYRALYVVSDILYLILYYIVGYRKNVVRNNLKNSFPNKSSEELLIIEKKFFKHLADIFIETIKGRTISKAAMNRRCKVRNIEIFNHYASQNKSFICVQGHYCNWEWTSHMAREVPHDIISVYKPLHNKQIDSYMIKLRERFGAITVSKNSILRVLARRQKKGLLSAVGVIGDQSPDITKSTLWISFLNQETAVFQGVERLATIYDIPVVFLRSYKVKRGHYEIELIPLSDNPKDLSPGVLTEKHFRITEKVIQDAPEYWMWSHKRWKWKKEDV